MESAPRTALLDSIASEGKYNSSQDSWSQDDQPSKKAASSTHSVDSTAAEHTAGDPSTSSSSTSKIQASEIQQASSSPKDSDRMVHPETGGDAITGKIANELGSSKQKIEENSCDESRAERSYEKLMTQDLQIRITELKRIRSQCPNIPKYSIAYARSLQESNQPVPAKKLLEKVLEKWPDNA